MMTEGTKTELSVLSERELAAEWRCTTAALRRMRREGRGPRWVRVGRLIRYPCTWAQEWLEANEGGAQLPATQRSPEPASEAEGLAGEGIPARPQTAGPEAS